MRIGAETVRRWAANLFVVAMLYLTADGMLLSWDVRWGDGWRGLPNLPLVERVVAMYVVFDRTTPTAFAYTAKGRPVARAEGSVELVELPLEEYFPQARGDAWRRLALWGHAQGQREALYARLAARLRRVHNRRHPEQAVEQVFLYEHWWPKSPAGYDHLRHERRTRIVGHDGPAAAE